MAATYRSSRIILGNPILDYPRPLRSLSAASPRWAGQSGYRTSIARFAQQFLRFHFAHLAGCSSFHAVPCSSFNALLSMLFDVLLTWIFASAWWFNQRKFTEALQCSFPSRVFLVSLPLQSLVWSLSRKMPLAESLQRSLSSRASLGKALVALLHWRASWAPLVERLWRSESLCTENTKSTYCYYTATMFMVRLLD